MKENKETKTDDGRVLDPVGIREHLKVIELARKFDSMNREGLMEQALKSEEEIERLRFELSKCKRASKKERDFFLVCMITLLIVCMIACAVNPYMGSPSSLYGFD